MYDVEGGGVVRSSCVWSKYITSSKSAHIDLPPNIHIFLSKQAGFKRKDTEDHTNNSIILIDHTR
jgi:hypothetical protein